MEQIGYAIEYLLPDGTTVHEYGRNGHFKTKEEAELYMKRCYFDKCQKAHIVKETYVVL